MKRFWKFFGAVLLCALLLPAFVLAETPDETAEKDFSDSADILRELGLFQGASGGYELERAPTRTEAAVMLVRLLGKEADALSSARAHPFKDTPKWADAHIAYLYANGLTKGVSASNFGTGACDANMYASFLLRVLGYDDAAGDFRYGDALSFAYEIDLLSSEHLQRLQTDAFLRGDLAVLSLWALFTEVKGDPLYLIDRLVSEGAVPAAAAKRYTDVLEAENLIARGFFLSEEENGYESRIAETYSLSEAGYTPITSRYILNGKGLLTDAGWREIYEITALLPDSEESYTVFRADGWLYYDYADGKKFKTPADPDAEEDTPRTLSGLFNRYKSVTIEERDGKTFIQEELSETPAEQRARETVSFLFGVDEDLIKELSREDYSTKLRHCTDTYTLDAEGYILQWTENIEFYFRLLSSFRDRPYLLTYDAVSDYSSHGEAVELVFPKDLQDYPLD
ncbi:MAG: hypothetical protein LBE16_06060 [Clostridiales Family XIII bacterium]|jgi:hypothetical protein|nr:hypothetical protein [Clostridiales Family XIII bacterium]